MTHSSVSQNIYLYGHWHGLKDTYLAWWISLDILWLLGEGSSCSAVAFGASSADTWSSPAELLIWTFFWISFLPATMNSPDSPCVFPAPQPQPATYPKNPASLYGRTLSGIKIWVLQMHVFYMDTLTFRPSQLTGRGNMYVYNTGIYKHISIHSCVFICVDDKLNMSSCWCLNSNPANPKWIILDLFPGWSINSHSKWKKSSARHLPSIYLIAPF